MDKVAFLKWIEPWAFLLSDDPNPRPGPPDLHPSLEINEGLGGRSD